MAENPKDPLYNEPKRVDVVQQFLTAGAEISWGESIDAILATIDKIELHHPITNSYGEPYPKGQLSRNILRAEREARYPQSLESERALGSEKAWDDFLNLKMGITGEKGLREAVRNALKRELGIVGQETQMLNWQANAVLGAIDLDNPPPAISE